MVENAQAEAQYRKMTETKVSRLIIGLSIPTIISMLVTSIYNLADTYFVSGLGTSQSAATGVVAGLMSILQAFGFMFGHGAGSNISRHLGSRNIREAREYASTSFYYSILAGALVMVVGLVFMDPLMRLLGSTDTILPYARQYALWILLAGPAMTSSCVMNNILRYEGKAVFAMFGLTAGGILNIFGDALLIRVFHMGIWGAGISTAVTQYISMFILALPFLRGKTQSAFAVKDTGLPYLGLYGACSTMAEGLGLAALLTEGGLNSACALTGSHFCAAERQYRFPLEYGGQRTPTAQWTVTGAGAVLLAKRGAGPRITHVTPGRIVDAGITDACNMGAAMAPAAFDTIMAHFRDTGRSFDDYDAVFTGDLGAIGHDILQDLLQREGLSPGMKYLDCGVLIYDLKTQDVHAGGSGCGCSAAVLCAHILPAMTRGVWKRVLFAGTGALMSPLSCQQGCSIPAVCHAVALEQEDA